MGVVSLALLSLREKVMSIIGLAKLIAKTFSNRNNSDDYYYYCISCGIKHSEISCPKCGSGFKYSIGGRQKRKYHLQTWQKIWKEFKNRGADYDPLSEPQ